MLLKFITKYEGKAVGFIGGFIVIMLAVMLIVMLTNTGEKIPITCEELNTKLIDMGYKPADTTYAYSDQNANLIRSIAIDTGKIRFDFFEFDNDNSALNLFKNSQAEINQKRNANSQDWTAHYNNYVMYSTQSDGIYYIVIRVGNTTIDAYCDAEYKSELDTILLSIDYGSSKNK